MANQKEKYFNENYFSRILKLSSENRLAEAIIEFHKYIEIYPRDMGGYLYCADTYIKIGNFDEAEKMLNRVVIRDNTSDSTKEHLLMFKIKLLCCQCNYKECLKLLMDNIDIYKKYGWNYKGTLLYLKTQLGILNSNDYISAQKNYLFSQIVSYDEERAISHISEHMPFDGNSNGFQFMDNFPLCDIYHKIREMLPLDNKVYVDAIGNSYVFKYDSNGHVGTKLVDYFMVIATKETNNIITMFPYENSERREYIDLTPVVEFPKQKKMSQIDKFNQRYSKR